MLKKVVIPIALFLATVLTPALSQSANASPEIFENMSGKWRGKGLVKSSPKGKDESIRCRMRNKIKNEGRLDLSGNCAVSGFVFSLKGYIEQLGSKNEYTASMFRSLANLKQSNFFGKRSGSVINFNFNAHDRLTRQDISATIRINSKSRSGFDIQIRRTDPETGEIFSVGTISFSKS